MGILEILWFCVAIVSQVTSENIKVQNSTGITKMLRIENLTDPYEIDLSKLNMTDSYYKNTKVLGGVLASPHYFPFQAALYIYFNNGGNTFCGGSLISRNYVLTAAHCVTNPAYVLVVLGATDLTKSESSQVRIYARRYIYHYQFNQNTLLNDISVIYLQNSVTYTVAVRPVQLPTYFDSRNSYDNTEVIVIGWGRTSDYGGSTTKLRYLQTRVLPNYICSNSFGISDTHICSTGYGGTGSCHGDSGGPLVHYGKQVGIVSFGSRICSSGLPSVYTRVTSYLPWLTSNTDVRIE